jgi:hypothetical protein
LIRILRFCGLDGSGPILEACRLFLQDCTVTNEKFSFLMLFPESVIYVDDVFEGDCHKEVARNI